MPELPEVETIRRDLEKQIINKRINNVFVLSPEVITTPKPLRFKKLIIGTTIKKIIRCGKLLIFELKRTNLCPVYLTVHLRMTGQLIVSRISNRARVSLQLSNRSFLNFYDQRKLGRLSMVDNWRKISLVRQLGPEPLNKDFTLTRFKQMLKNKKTKIKPLLIDQKFLAGIGNLYAAEILFLSRISPKRIANSLNEREITSLYNNIKKVLKLAIKCRGSSVDTYRDAKGEKGTFTRHLKVYARRDKPCFACKTPIKRIVLGGRGTYFCEVCQQ
ncbi:MAG: DNA-formamidopyrimidine glycosylase [Candidatus Omnitrophota bacterium]